MILVDTSIWIELSRGRLHPIRAEEESIEYATCGPIVQEVVQGVRPGAENEAFLEAFFAVPVLADPVPLRLFMEAAEIYRQGRRRRITIRSSVDCLIAAIAIDQKVRVWSHDRDFSAIARYTPLETV